MLQFFGSILQLTPHAHSWLPDGVFHTDSDGKLQFYRLPPPSDGDVTSLLLRIEQRVMVACAEYEEDHPDESQRVMASTQLEASRPPLYTIALTDEERPYRPRWMDLLERVFGYDLACPRCHGPMQVIQVVEEPLVIEKILTHLGLPTSLPRVSPARAPPGDELDLCFAQTPDTEPDWLD